METLFFQDLVENSPDLIQVISPEGRLLYVNRSWLETLGYESQDLANLNFFDLLHPDPIGHHRSIFQRALQGKKVRNSRMILVTKQGHRLEFHGYAIPQWQDGKIVAAQSVLRPLSAQAEEGQRQVEQWLRQAVEHAPISMALVTLDGRILRANRALCSFLRYSRDRLEGMNIMEITHQEDAALEHSLFQRALTGNLTVELEKRYRRGDGSIVKARLSAAIVTDTDGNPIYVIGQVMDISEYKRTERILRDSEAELIKLIETLPIALLIADGATLIAKLVNARFIEIFGYTMDDFQTIEQWWLLAYPDPDYRERVKRDWSQLTDQLRQGHAFVPYEAEVTCKDGSRKYIEFRLSIVGPKHVVSFIDLTESKRYERALAQARDDYLRILNEAPVLIRRADRAGRWDWFNQTWLEFTDRSLEQQLQHGWSTDIHPDDSEFCHRTFQEAFANRRPYTMEYRLYGDENPYRWVLEVGQPLASPDNTFSGYIVYCIDINERKQTERELILVNSRLEHLLTVSPAVIYTARPDTEGATYVSPNIRAQLGYEPNDFLTPGFWVDRIHPDDKAQVPVSFMRQPPPEQYRAEYRFRHRDGAWRWLLDVASLRFDPWGRPEMVGSVFDITEGKEAVLAMQQSETRLRYLLEQLIDGILVVDPVTRQCLFVNQVLCRLLGYSREKLLASRLAELNLDQLIDNPAHELEIHHQDGTSVQVELRWTDVMLGSHGYRMGLFRDITERSKLERMKREFISIVSHELRTPLTAIQGSLSLLLGNVVGGLPTAAGELLQIADSNARRLVALVNDILDTEKLDAGTMTFASQPWPLMPLVEQAVTLNQAFAEQYGGAIAITERVSDTVKVRVDDTRLLQVLTNLLSNAAKFSPAATPIRVTVQTAADWVKITVIDAGPGIPEQLQPLIFQKFSQIDASDSRNKGGTGLGLYLSKTLVERLGGRIGFTTTVGNGSCFYVELPVYPE